MKISKACNMSLLEIIARAKEITCEELKKQYLPPEQPGVVQGVTVMFDSDLKDLESEGYISINNGVITFIEKEAHIRRGRSI